jgi:predicted TPR repeat methyltransferase
LNLARAIEIAPDHIVANHELAKTYDEWGKRDKAAAAWKKVRKLTASKPEHAAIAAEAAKALTRLAR